MFVVDTNLLLYALNPDSPDHKQAYRLLEDWRKGDRPWFLSWGIIYEFLRVATHPTVFPKPLDLQTAWQWIQLLLATPSVRILVETERHQEILEELTDSYPRLYGNLVHDFHTSVLMREHGISEIRTADTDFHQFNFLKVVNPL